MFEILRVEFDEKIILFVLFYTITRYMTLEDMVHELVISEVATSGNDTNVTSVT